MSDGWFRSPPRLAVAGGVRVAKPGSVDSELSRDLVAAVVATTKDTVATRGRTYARAGQVVDVRVAEGEAHAAVQGSERTPYAVGLRQDDGRWEATCTCPYGSTPVEWCKHAAALAYLVADLLDRDAQLLAAWTGEPAARGRVHSGAGVAVAPAVVARLRRRVGPVDVEAQLTAAAAVVPLP